MLDSNVMTTATTNGTLTNMNANSSSLSIQMSPSSAVQSIISSYVKDNRVSSPIQPVKPNSRVRVERRFGENITNGNLLQDLKGKEQVKKDKEQAKKDKEQAKKDKEQAKKDKEQIKKDKGQTRKVK